MDMTAYTMTCARAHTLTHTHTHTRTHTHNATRPSIACQAHTYKQPSVLQYDTHTQHTHTHTHTTHRNGRAPDVSLLQRTCVRQGGRPLPQQHLLHHQHLQHLQQQQAVTSNSKQGSVGPPLAAQQHAMLQAKQLPPQSPAHGAAAAAAAACAIAAAWPAALHAAGLPEAAPQTLV